MAYDPANIGKARLLVEMLPQSPFNAIPQQELGYYFTTDNLPSMVNPVNIIALPNPLNGFRNAETSDNFDNFLVDASSIPLEVASVPSTDNPGVLSLVDSKAAELFIQVTDLRPDATSGNQKQFFTWKTSENLFVIDQFNAPGQDANSTNPTIDPTTTNPAPTTFANLSTRTDNSPKWTYNIKTSPNGEANVSPLTPFMTRVSPSRDRAVHWGCVMTTAMAQNQAFEITFYHEGQIHTPADTAPKMDLRFAGITDIDLTRKAYFALETGRGTPSHYLFLFVQNLQPRFYVLSGTGQQQTATLTAQFSAFSGEKLFNPENANFTVKVEPVGESLLVTSNQFNDTPWIIQGNAQSIFFIGKGPLAVYSGNVQAGFYMRPIQYLPTGTFQTPLDTIIQTPNDSRTPVATTALKGAGEVQQNINSDGTVHAVDAEFVNGQKITSFIEADAGQAPDPGAKRKIFLTVKQVTDPNSETSQAPATGPAGQGLKKTYQTSVKLQSSDLAQGNGFVVTNGRSPYIWQERLDLVQAPTQQGAFSGVDISCDVLSCELAWNSTSYNELSHTGTLKVLNRPRVGTGEDYRGFTNRAIYFRISAWWENGAGHDPGSDDRVIFNGMSVGATVETTLEREVVTFKLEDYMNALEGGKFILSPYYDGMKASKAVADIVKQLGVADASILSGDSPISTNTAAANEFVLPFANPFEEPQFRFKDGSSYKAAVVKIATLDGKVVFFDTKGNFHYDDIPGGILGDQNTPSVVDFFSSVSDAPSAAQVVWNQAQFTRAVNDTYNVLQVSTVDKETGALIHIADANFAGLHDPQAEGYLGYRKHLLIREPALGSAAAAGKYFNTYRERIFIPPLTTRFETYGYSGLKPLDTITLDGQKVRILNVSLSMNAQENQFWMTVEGEWYFTAGKWQNSNVSDNPGAPAA